MPSCVTLQCIKLLASQVLPSIMYTCCCRCQGPEHFVKTDSKQQAVINEDEKVNISRETCFEKKIISDSWLNFSAIYLFDLCIFHSESEFISYGFTSSVFGLLELIDCLIFLWCRKQRWEFVLLLGPEYWTGTRWISNSWTWDQCLILLTAYESTKPCCMMTEAVVHLQLPIS